MRFQQKPSQIGCKMGNFIIQHQQYLNLSQQSDTTQNIQLLEVAGNLTKSKINVHLESPVATLTVLRATYVLLRTKQREEKKQCNGNTKKV